MRIVLVAESFLPAVNGVTRSLIEISRHLAPHHELTVLAPEHPHVATGHDLELGAEVTVRRLPSVLLPGYPELAVGLPGRHIDRALDELRPDVLYCAAPVVLGHRALQWANRAEVRSVAVHQTDLAGFARHYHLHGVRRLVERRLRATYGLADRVLAPSRSACAALRGAGVPRVHLWPRGVDLTAFSPSWRPPALRQRWLGSRSPEVVVGYSGRFAAEKRLELLAGLDRVAGAQLVVVGDGPQRQRLERLLPGAVFTGNLRGEALSRAVASFDLFVHAGTAETFCQAIQEALAAQVPVVAPNVGGPTDLVQPGINGVTYRPGDASELFDAVHALCRDDQRRAELRAQARVSVRPRSWAAVCRELDGHLREVTNGRPAVEHLQSAA